MSQAQGTAGASFCSMLLQSEKCDAELEYCIKLCANGIFEGTNRTFRLGNGALTIVLRIRSSDGHGENFCRQDLRI